MYNKYEMKLSWNFFLKLWILKQHAIVQLPKQKTSNVFFLNIHKCRQWDNLQITSSINHLLHKLLDFLFQYFRVFKLQHSRFVCTKTKEDKSYKNKKLIYLLEAFSEHLCNDKYVKLFYNYFKYGLFQNLEWITK